MRLLQQKGVMNLTLLMLLSSFLLFWLLLDEANLSLYSEIAALRLHYVEQSLELQNQYQQVKGQYCESIKSQSEHSMSVNIQRSNNTLQQYFYCVRYPLFKKIPTERVNTVLNEYFESSVFSEFLPHFNLPQNGVQSLQPQIYWFPQHDNQWEIEGNVNGIILSAGDLTIRGRGVIEGAIILNGQLHLDNVALRAKKSIVKHLAQQYSRWQLAEKSWHDFDSE